ncbi:MAG: OsmC family protein [Acidobacteriota bacterium]
MKIDVKHLGDVQFSIATGRHEICCDQPSDNGGDDDGMTPPELFLGALGACAAYYAVAHLKRHNLPHEGTTVQASSGKLTNPARLGEIVLRVSAPVTLTSEQQNALERSVTRCILHNTLTHPPAIRTEIAASPSAEQLEDAELILL